MAYQVEVKKEDKKKAVKTKKIDFEGKPAEGIVLKTCPLVGDSREVCRREACEWYADEIGACAIQVIVVRLGELIHHE